MYPNSSVRFDTISGHNQKLMANSQIELSISARKLVDRDITSKSDPQCIVYMKQGFNNKFIEIGRTETIKDNLNPDWVKRIEIQFKFNESQQLKFEIWDIDPVSGNEFLGQITVELGAILATKGGSFQQKLTSGGKNPRRFGGQIVIRAEELSANKQIALMSFSASGLDNKDFMGKSDPYLAISKANNDGTFSIVHKTEVIKNTLSPQWRPFNIRLQQLCGGDSDRNLKFDCYDWDDNGSHDLIGSFITTLRKLSAGPSQQNIYECINSEKQKRKKSYKNSGVIKLNSISITQEVTFLDYIRGGTQMHFAVAVDFTASNGDVRDPRSLHFLDHTGDRPNSYEIALRSVGEIIKNYDTQGLFASYGFGAKIPPHGQVSHLFPLNNNPSHPYCRGIQEIISCYKSSLNAATLYGPTNFAPVINSTSSIARGLQDGRHYFVLLIITDGAISDLNETLDAIVNASSLPLSIIIIGVGDADFSSMNFLDGDGTSLVSNGRRAVRDIVQFVPMNKFSYGDWQQNQHHLGREVLLEIPTQFTQFMQSRGFKPSPPGTATKGAFPEPTGNEPSVGSGYPPSSGSMYPQTNASAASYPPSGPGGYPPSGPPQTGGAYPPSGPGVYAAAGPTSAPGMYPPSAAGTYPSAAQPLGPGMYPSSGAGPYPSSGQPPVPGIYPPSAPGAYPPSSMGSVDPNYPKPNSSYPSYPSSNPYPPPSAPTAYPSTNPSGPNPYHSGPNPYPPSGQPQYPSAPPNTGSAYPSYPSPNQASYPPY